MTVSWNSPGTPDAISETYLTDYFNKGYTIWAEDYLKKRISYNNSNIGEFGFAVYLTSGTNSTYVGFTKDTSMEIDLNKYRGTFDGVIIKSMYSIFKNNASDGIKISFNVTGNEDKIFDVSISNSTKTLNLNDKYSYLDSSSVSAIMLDGIDVKNVVSGLTVSYTSISGDGGPTIDNFTATAGTYKITYTVTFKYEGKTYGKKVTQIVTVK